MILIPINFAVHISAFGAVLAFGDYRTFDQTMALVGFLLMGVTSHIALAIASRRRLNGLGALTIGLVVYFWVTYSGKFALAMFIADEYWVVPKLIDATNFLRILPEAYFLSAIGFVAMVLGVTASPLQHSIDWTLRPARPRLWMMVAFVCLGLVIKYFLKARYALGVPGLDPLQLPIPYLSGILALLLGFAMMFFANVPFFLALFKGNRWTIFLTFILAMVNAVIDLRFGSKDTLMFQMALVVAYIFIFNAGLIDGRVKFRRTAYGMIILVGVLGWLVGSAYKYLNFIRFAFLSGATSVAAAIQIASESEVARQRSSLIELYNRITGIEAFTAVMELTDSISFNSGLSDLISGTLMRRFSDIVLAGVDSTAAFSMTLIGSWYVYGGIPAIIFGCLLTGALFAFLQYVTIRAPGMCNNMRLAFLPVYWIMCVQLTLGGNPTIWLKTMIVTLPFVFVVGRYAFRRPPRHRREMGVQTSPSTV